MVALTCMLDLKTRTASVLFVVTDWGLTYILHISHVGEVGLDTPRHDSLFPGSLS
jgi:hypothetical protein